MSLSKLSWLVALCHVFCLAGVTAAQPVVTVTDDFGSLPEESFFASNPTAIVNVEAGGGISPDGIDFNGATVNINDRGAYGWHTLHPFADDVSLNLHEGGVLHRSTFTGATGGTNVTIHDGFARGLLTMQGNAVLNVEGGMLGGGQAQGAPSFTAEGDSQVTISGGVVEDYGRVQGSAELTIAGGEVGDFLAVEEAGHLTISGGSVGRLTHARSPSARVNITGGILDREFMATDGAMVNMTGGAIGDNSIVRDGVMNMSGGVLGHGFKVFNSTLNMSGGTFGGSLRLGSWSNAPGTLNLFIKSATIDGDLLDIGVGEAIEISRRDDAFLVAELVDGSSVGLLLNDDVTHSTDFLHTDSTLNLIRQAGPADFDLDGDTDADDLDSWRTDYGNGHQGSHFLTWQRNYSPGAISPILSTVSVPEPATLQMIVTIVAAIVGRRPRRSAAVA